MQLRTKNLTGWWAVAALAMAPLAIAQNSANRMTGASDFAVKATQGGLAEVQLGQLAQQHARSQAVKDFGAMMVQDHTKANDDLKNVAVKQGLTLPGGMDAKDQREYDRLSKLHGAEFDRAYMRDMVADHRMDVSEFKHEAEHGADPALKAFASRTLPVLEHHLQVAETADKEVAKEHQ